MKLSDNPFPPQKEKKRIHCATLIHNHQETAEVETTIKVIIKPKYTSEQATKVSRQKTMPICYKKYKK